MIISSATWTGMPNIITIRKGGYRDLIGKSLFDCHDREMSRERIKVAYEKNEERRKRSFHRCKCPQSTLLYAGGSGWRGESDRIFWAVWVKLAKITDKKGRRQPSFFASNGLGWERGCVFYTRDSIRPPYRTAKISPCALGNKVKSDQVILDWRNKTPGSEKR